MPRELTRYEKIKIKVEKRLGWGWNAYRTTIDPDLRFMIRVGSRDAPRGWCFAEASFLWFRFIVLELPKES